MICPSVERERQREKASLLLRLVALTAGLEPNRAPQQSVQQQTEVVCISIVLCWGGGVYPFPSYRVLKKQMYLYFMYIPSRFFQCVGWVSSLAEQYVVFFFSQLVLHGTQRARRYITRYVWVSRSIGSACALAAKKSLGLAIFSTGLLASQSHKSLAQRKPNNFVFCGLCLSLVAHTFTLLYFRSTPSNKVHAIAERGCGRPPHR